MDFEEQLTWKQRLSRFTVQCARVLSITKKPGKEEYSMLVKISGIGILVIGLLGFIIFMLRETLLPF